MKKERKRVLTTDDLVFKKVFASPQNSHILIGFINDVLGLGVTEVHVEDTYNIRTFYEENKKPKLSYTQVDVLARLGNGSLVTIEMQVHKKTWFLERMVFYVNETYNSNYGKQELEVSREESADSGRKYSALRPTYGICIMMNNEFEEDNKPVHHFTLYDVENELFLQNKDGQVLINVIFLELKKSSEEMKAGLKDWFDYFLSGKVATEAPKYLQDACRVAEYQNLEQEEKKMISAKEKAEQDAGAEREYIWQEGRAEGRAEGKAEGRAEGEAKGRTELIKTLLSKGKSIEEIVEFFEIDEDELKKILGKNYD